MRLSTRGKYGVKAMAELALHYGEGPTSLKLIAERQGLSEHYLEQLIAPLRKAGLVRSLRGAQGGYLLGRQPATITVGEIVRVLEGPIAPSECASEVRQRYHHCGTARGCVTRKVWTKLRDSIASALDSVTLADLCKEAKDVSKGMYYI